jgi:hypothetical protein
MNIRKLLIFAFLCAASFELLSATLPFRLGNILSAEISRNKVVIKNMNPLDYDFKFKHYAYAVVVLKLHKGRTLSVYDFKLNFKDKAYKCIALREGSKAFDTKNWHVVKTDTKTIYSLLFIIDSEVLGNAKKELPLTLVYSLFNSGQVNRKVPFKFVNYDNLTPLNKIPANGIFPKIKIKSRKTFPNKAKK